MFKISRWSAGGYAASSTTVRLQDEAAPSKSLLAGAGASRARVHPEPEDCCATLSCCESKPTRAAAGCSAKTTVAAKVALCCGDPSIASALVAGEACAAYATVSDTANAKAAVAGMAAFVPVK